MCFVVLKFPSLFTSYFVVLFPLCFVRYSFFKRKSCYYFRTVEGSSFNIFKSPFLRTAIIMSTVRHSIPSTSDAHLGEESDNIVKNNQVRTKTRQPSLRKAFMMFSLLIVLLLILESDALPLQSPPNRNSELMSNYMTQIQR